MNPISFSDKYMISYLKTRLFNRSLNINSLYTKPMAKVWHLHSRSLTLLVYQKQKHRNNDKLC